MMFNNISLGARVFCAGCRRIIVGGKEGANTSLVRDHQQLSIRELKSKPSLDSGPKCDDRRTAVDCVPVQDIEYQMISVKGSPHQIIESGVLRYERDQTVETVQRSLAKN
jgi:hypothetical protein|uniref:Uncharacterized protein n=1 Tax=Sipha flava TaxID=143950 RepID=A0A2S2QDA6_9HEMI